MVKPGDRVRIKTKDGEHVGILMPRPEKVPGNSVIIKLKTGYNKGIARKNIVSMYVLEPYKKKTASVRNIPYKKGLPNIAILSTGGTISSKVDYETGGTFPAVSVGEFIQMVPELEQYGNYEVKQMSQVWSEDIASDDWIKLAKEVYSQIKKGKRGIIITQGTDTMHYNAAALSFMVQNLPVPVIFVAAQRSIDRGSSDAFPNLLTAAITAAKWDGAETVICMHGSTDDNANILIRGTKARKMHTERRDAFKPINDMPLARVDYNGNIVKVSNYKLRSDSKPVLNTKIDKKVALIWTYPGIDPKIFDYYIKQKYHGIVIAGTGFGNVPRNVVPILKKFYRAGIPVVMTSQCIFGRVNARVYERGRKQLFEGKVIYGEDMTPETAFVKLMFVLGQTKNMEKVKEMMTKNLVGEISPRTTTNYL